MGRKEDKELPRSGLNFLPDKGKAGVDAFNHMNGTDFGGGEGCCEDFKTPSDRTHILLYVTYKNPYEDKEVEESCYLPTTICAEAIRKFCEKVGVKVDATDTALFELFGYTLHILDDLEDNVDFTDIAVELYKKSEYYEKDVEQWIDDYEFDHDLGKYSGEN